MSALKANRRPEMTQKWHLGIEGIEQSHKQCPTVTSHLPCGPAVKKFVRAPVSIKPQQTNISEESLINVVHVTK